MIPLEARMLQPPAYEEERKCCEWRWLVRETDTKEEARIKTRMFPFAVALTAFNVMALILTYRVTGQNISAIGLSLTSVGMLMFAIGAATNAAPVGSLLDVMLVMWSVGLCLNDLGGISISYHFRVVAVIIICLDVALVFKRDHMPPLIITLMSIYLILTTVEGIQRFGLYELGYWGTDGVEISACNCASPPCAQNPVGSAIGLFGSLIVFLGDFYFSRGFAKGMRLQLHRVEVSIQVAGEIASALAKYDTEAAEVAIEEGADIPAELADAFV
eukprot:Hpha_TRINITY_DN15236_c6_g4::TRINITY_DN15236_c6_g4_i2::g.65466::m.65466